MTNNQFNRPPTGGPLSWGANPVAFTGWADKFAKLILLSSQYLPGRGKFIILPSGLFFPFVEMRLYDRLQQIAVDGF